MNQSEFFSLVIESCLVDCTIDLTFNWSTNEFEKNSQVDSRIAQTFPFLLGPGWIYEVTIENKAAFPETFVKSFKSADFCHFIIKHEEKEIGKSFDNADSNLL